MRPAPCTHRHCNLRLSADLGRPAAALHSAALRLRPLSQLDALPASGVCLRGTAAAPAQRFGARPLSAAARCRCRRPVRHVLQPLQHAAGARAYSQGGRARPAHGTFDSSALRLDSGFRWPPLTRCVQGLAGLATGRQLLQAAVEMLQRQHPAARFGTLSPIPGFRRWLRHRLASEQEASALRLHEQAGRQMLLERLLMSEAELAQGALGLSRTRQRRHDLGAPSLSHARAWLRAQG